MAAIDEYREKFTDSGRAVLDEAIKKSEQDGKKFVSIAHLIYALSLSDRPIFDAALEKLSISPTVVKEIILKHLELSKKHRGKGFQISPAVTEVFKRSMDRARTQGRWKIDSFDILTNLADDPSSLLNEILSEFDSEPEEVALSVRLAMRKASESDASLSTRTAIPEEKIASETSTPLSKRVFVVHGQDELAKVTLARFLENLQLEAVILHEQASSSSTIIEKLENYSDVSYSVVLLTPDDVGGLAAGLPAKDSQIRQYLSSRSRQNVIFELGFFIGKLGRSRVCALYKGNIELPTDYAGVVYVSMDENGAWKQILARELEAVGLNIDHKGLLK